MSMRLYKVSGQWYTWDYLHNELGYTESASTTTAYKSSDSDTWGQSVVDSGYRIAEDSSDLETYEFWIDNVSGWFSASEMAQEGYYPSFATDGPRFVKEGELSVSVEISGNSWSGSWYLLKKDVAIGWCTERELEENGWEPDRGEIVGGLISDTYDKRIYSFGNGGLLVTGGYAYSDGALLDMQWDFGGVVKPGGAEKTYLLANSLDSNNKPVTVTFEPDYYWWSRVIDAETKTELNDISFWANTSYPFGSAKYDYTTLKLELVGVYTDENGTIRISNDLSMFSINPYGTNRVVGLYSANGCPTPVATYRVRVVEKTFLLANSLDSNNKPVAVTFEAGWNWWSRVVNTETKEELSNLSFWVSTAYPFGSAKYANGSQTLELVGVYTDAEGTNRVENDLSIFDLRELGSGVAGLNSVNGCSTPVMTYRVKIKIPETLPTVSSLNGVVGTLSQQGTQASVADGDSVYHYIYVDGAYQLTTLGAGNTLGIARIGNNLAENIQRGVGWVAERTSDGYVKITNNSGATYTNLYSAWLAYCDSTNVTVVTVYKLSDGVAYNAFKCVLNGTDYYYVLDNTTSSTMDWTDYPESIGYSRYPFESLNEIAFNSVTLPENHLGAYVGTVFDSLRYYAKGTLSNTGSISGTYFGRSINYFYGTLTWTDRSLGDLTDKIAITNLTDQSISLQSLFRIIFIYSEITGYHPSDTETNDNFISNYTYRDGEHSITFYCTVNAWIDTQYPDIGRIQIRYLDGTTMFNGLSGFDLFDAPSFNILSKSTTTDRYGMYSSWNGFVKVYALYSNFIYVPVLRAYLSTNGAAASGDITLYHGNHLLYDKTGTPITFESKYYRLLKLTKYYGDDTTPSGLSLSNDGGNLVIYNQNNTYYPDVYVIEYLCIPSQLTNQTIKAYKSDGTVSNCELDNNGHYRIASFDNNAWHTEPELNTGGWYIRWRIYSTTNQGGVNIRDNGSVIGTNTIGRYYPSQHPIGNPFLIQVDPNDSTYTMQKLLFTEDNGSTVQTGWTVCVGNNTVSFTLSLVDSDVAFLSNF